MIMDTDTVEARLLAAHDERGEVGQRSPNRDSEIDADPTSSDDGSFICEQGGHASILHFARIRTKRIRPPTALDLEKDMRMFRLLTRFCLMTIAAAIAYPAVGQCEDTLKLAVGAPNNWDSGVPEIGRRAGIFQKHGLNLELLYTSGGGETVQAVISGSVDLGIGAGTGGVLGAFAKGAPVRILLAGTTGASDLYWYVPTASPLKSFNELAGKTVAYSTNGASTHITLLALIKHFNVTAEAPVDTGFDAGHVRPS